jgi:acyl carrier protein
VETTSVSPGSTGRTSPACSASQSFEVSPNRREIKDRIRNIVRNHAGLNLPLKDIEDSTDLYYAGMSSQASVVLMIAVESQFGLEFPDAMLNRDVFANIETIADAVECVLGDEQ